MRKMTNFEQYLELQLQDPEFAERFRTAGAAWDLALGRAAKRS